MAQIQVTINGRAYNVACDDGQEEHVGRLGRYIEHKVADLVQSVGQVGDARLLLMAGLVIADELADAEHQLERAKSELGDAGGATPEDEAPLCRALDGLAERIEAIAAGLDRA